MSHEIHRNQDRGHLDHGWLKTAHSFSFAHYVNEARMNFGALLVINEDTIQPTGGFGEHFHDNMEIITIPLSGALEHRDSMGNHSVIRAGDIQIMSAGTGIMHSEFNPSSTEAVHLLQIWIIPNKRGLPTRYEQMTVGEPSKNVFHTIIAPSPVDGTLTIHQDAWFQQGRFDAGQAFSIKQHDPAHGTFLFVMEGKIQIGEEVLSAGDAFAMQDEIEIVGTALESSHLLAIEVPMKMSFS